MPKSSTIAVLLGVHNAQQSLDKTLQSLAEQSCQDFIVVAVNDASTDDSGLILKRWRQQFGPDRFLLIENQTNLGLTKSLNLGLRSIRSPYTARIDADDWWTPDKLAKQLDYFNHHPETVILGTNYINVGATGEKKISLHLTDREIKRRVIKRNPFAHSCVMFKTEVIRKLGSYDPAVRYGQDYDLWLRCLKAGEFANLPEFLCYRAIGRGISVDKQRQQMQQTIRTQRKYIQRYNLSPLNYLYMIEPLILVLTPNWLKNLKRKLVS